MAETTRRTLPAAIRVSEGRAIVTDAAGGEFSFRGATIAELEFTAGKLEAEAKCAGKKAAYLRAALAGLTDGNLTGGATWACIAATAKALA